MPEVWPLLEYMHANTVEAPVYWEQMEPKPGEFDFSIVDELVKQTRDHKLHLVLLWFGTWKNGKMHYVPEWIKADTQRYPRVITERGEPIDVLSANAPANLEADKKAFVALMRHLKEIDGDQHTVLLVQVENESGSLGSVRDFSPLAEKDFQGQVPAELAKALHKTTGTWKQVFGADANETFAAYSVARYINEVARAGKTEFPVPMYVNVWLKWPRETVPGLNYPSGGPTYNMLDVWKATASSLDVIGPDIYTDDSALYRFALKSYHRPDNAMWIPETGGDDIDAHYFFYALGEGAIGFSPFGMDRTGWTYKPDEGPVLHAENFALIGPMSREIARLNFEGKVKTAVEEEGEYQKELDFGNWQATVSFGFPQYGRERKPAESQGPSWPRAGGAAFGKRVPGNRNRCAHRVPPSCRYGRKTSATSARGGRRLRKRDLEVSAPVERRPDRFRIEFHSPGQSRSRAPGTVLAGIWRVARPSSAWAGVCGCEATIRIPVRPCFP